jgi:exonuclease SbcD|nr:MAG TPA: putative DNA double strand break repair [Caudoviricetes sp.]
MRNPLFVISNDKHLTNQNIEIFEDLCKQEIKLATDLGVKDVLWLGDIFDSRIAQREEVLNAVGRCIEYYHAADLTIHCIPGNHDKTVYSSPTSFLDAFVHHPGFDLMSYPIIKNIAGVEILFMPFFEDGVWIDLFDQANECTSNETILCSHIAVKGSRNNDGTTVDTPISPALLSGFKCVFLGHYHNAQKIGKNIYHLPSTYQRNFGEDAEKGFTVYYDDGTHELVKSKFKEYRKIKVDTDSLTDEEILDLARQNSEGDGLVRLELVGDQNRLKSINKGALSSMGVDVKMKFTEVEVQDNELTEEVKEFTSDEILKKFEVFCKEKGYKLKTGKKYLEAVCQTL